MSLGNVMRHNLYCAGLGALGSSGIVELGGVPVRVKDPACGKATNVREIKRVKTALEGSRIWPMRQERRHGG
jgi:hypothetical protein